MREAGKPSLHEESQGFSMWSFDPINFVMLLERKKIFYDQISKCRNFKITKVSAFAVYRGEENLKRFIQIQ